MKHRLLHLLISFLVISGLFFIACIIGPLFYHNDFIPLEQRIEAQTYQTYCESAERAGLEAYDFEQLNSTTAVSSFTASKITPVGADGRPTGPSAKAVIFTVETNAIRYLYHPAAATTVSGTVGHTAAAGDTPYCVSGINNIRNFRFTRATADGKLNTTYLR